MKKWRFAAMAILCVPAVGIAGCGAGIPNGPKKPNGSSAPAYTAPPVEDKVDMLKNEMRNMNIEGAVGKILTANETVWVQKVLQDNPRLFDAFLHPEENDLAKAMWHGEFPGKLLSGIAQTYLLNNDPRTKETGDRMVALFQEAQGEDGYLGPWSEAVRYNKDVLDPNTETWGKWDTWGQYHCIYGLYRWYQITGNQEALHIAVRALDGIYNYFIVGGQTFVSQNWAECNLAIGHAFALLYEATGKPEYLQAAEYIVNEEWNMEYPDFYSKTILSCGWMTAALEGKAFYESGQPRWEGLYALETLAVLYRVTGNETYGEAMESLWWGMVGTDRHNTGSFGTGEGATGDPYGHGSETCNIVAWMAFSTDYLKMSKNSYVADELELSFYNASLGSLLAGEREFTYMNHSDGSRESALIILEGHSFDGGRDMSCCQANGNRGISQVAEWALLTGTDGLYLNYYGASNMQTQTAGGNSVTLRQETQYPKNGAVKITVTAEQEESFVLRLRIPVWSEQTVVRVNGEVCEGVRAGTYYEISRSWKTGDVIELHFDMQMHFWMAEKGTIGQKVSVYYGPLLLAYQTSDSLRPTTRFEIDTLRAMEPIEGDGLVSFRCTSSKGEAVIFTDYYSAGRNGEAFVSWIVAGRDLETISFEKYGNPVWNNR